MATVLFPGSFDPYTLGHHSVVLNAAQIFDQVIIGVGNNTTKKYLYSLEQRVNAIERTYADMPNISVCSFPGLTVDFAASKQVKFILRGLRNGLDFEYERNIAFMNKSLNDEIETVFLLCAPEYAGISSSIVRELIRNNADISAFVPEAVVELSK